MWMGVGGYPTLEKVDIVGTVDALQPVSNLVFVPTPVHVSHVMVSKMRLIRT